MKPISHSHSNALKRQTFQLLTLFVLGLLGSCNWINPPEDVPAFVMLQEPRVCLDSTCTDIRPHGLKAAWVYREELPVPLGVFGTYSRFPLPDAEQKEIVLRAGVFENGISNFIKEYPFLQQLRYQSSGVKGKTDTLKADFRYLSDSLLSFPISENFEGQDLQLEPFSVVTDSTRIERSIESPYEGAYCGKIVLNSNRQLIQLQSTREFTLPGNGAEVWLEITTRGDVNVQAGLVSNQSGNVRVLNQNTILKNPDWTQLYLNFTPLASTYSNGTFRLWLKVEGEGKSGAVYIDRIRLIHFRQ